MGSCIILPLRIWRRSLTKGMTTRINATTVVSLTRAGRPAILPVPLTAGEYLLRVEAIPKGWVLRRVRDECVTLSVRDDEHPRYIVEMLHVAGYQRPPATD